MRRPEVLLFDVGGVLVELGGLSVWDRLRGEADPRGRDEVMTAWIRSPVVRRFESGRCSAEAFAREAVAEFSLAVSADEFIREFAAFPRGILPGARELLTDLAGHRLACFSNTNALHWPIMFEEFGLCELFERAFASHELGLLKPDREAFEAIAAELAVAPGDILFLDDATLNVEGARAAGLQAEQAVGPAAAREILDARGLFSS